MEGGELDALVIGAGVCGLTTAISLAEAGLRVTIWAADLPPDTTSASAGAMWGPYLTEPVDRVQGWSRITLDELRPLADRAGTGVRLVRGVEASRTATSPPPWADQLDRFEMCEPTELPDGFVTGWRFTAPIIDMPTYLDFLHRRLTSAGGSVQLRRLGSLHEARGAAPTVVNCSGLGARELVPDPDLVPIQGQLVIVENPGLSEFFTEDTGLDPELLHIYPQGQVAVLGGLASPGQSSTRPDPGVAAGILDRCRAVEPCLHRARVLGHRAGARPTRPEVRLEEMLVDGTRLIHNYGHGGAGVTLSWGCAAEVVAAVQRSRG